MVSSISMSSSDSGTTALTLPVFSSAVGLLERNQLFGLGGLRLIGSGGGRSGRRRRVRHSPRAAAAAQPAQSGTTSPV